MKKALSLSVLIISLLVISCQKQEAATVDLEKEKAEILKLHHAQRDHHFGKDSIAFASQLSEDFISVNRGEITKPTYEENLGRYHAYFSSVEFEKWDDTAEPTIRFSEDGKMAYTIVEKEIVIRFEENGKPMEESTEYAWVSIYRKYDDGWKIDCVSSTNKPSTVRELTE
ncbi:DUF4440 domain-containing protein [Leptobacterium flavescens]|uniref:DUF4440 domain-containing protein n=1 Tax=Leptobacterium flavescens TaxID=472055 RepID=A0A6P0UKS6_9FLAO|nr:nuclear transport factor 2 family protein [Leptobacterium flavescens]NER13020.1 DUF4440 domain-containing protein [Leptobacterium flavescens]